MAVSRFLSSAVLDRLNQSTGRAVGLPGDCFTSPAFLACEQADIFARNWIFACALDELAEPGTALPLTVAGQPILVVSDKKGRIRAFHNLCSHRGAQLVTEPATRLGVIRCPYHSWAYALDGSLRTAPHCGGMGVHKHPDLEPSQLGLKPVRCETWHRLVFVNLSATGPSLAEFLAPLVARWPVDYGVLRLGGVMRFELKANWKLAIENYSESYHLPSIHPGLNSYSPIDDHYQFFIEGVGSGQGTARYQPPATKGCFLPQFRDLPPSLAGRGEYPIVFPNLMLGTQADHFFLLTAEPVAPDLTRERFYVFFVGEEAMTDAYAEARHAVLDRWRQINLEDTAIVERLQLGRASSAMTGGRFSPAHDACLHDFQKRLAAALLEGERVSHAERARPAPVAAE